MENLPKKPRGKRGQGCVFRPKGSRNWWIKFSYNGQVTYKNSETESKKDATRFLQDEILRRRQGVSGDSDRTTVSYLADSMIQTWQLEQHSERSLRWMKGCWNVHLLPFFGKMKANKVSSADLRNYTEKRKQQDASNASINRELSILQSAFSLGYDENPRRVAAKLSFKRLPESKPRQGFVEEAQYRAILANCTDTYLCAMVALAFSFGFRKGELLGLRVSDCDLLAGAIRLRTSKNGEPRTVPLTAETRSLLASCICGKGPDAPVFTRNGKIVSDFRGTWDAVTKAAGCDGLLFHDLRRSAVRNMVRRGVPEVVAMRISGHKTRSVFDRYNIVSERDLAEAAKKIESLSLSERQVKVAEGEEKTKADENVTIQ